MEGGVMDDSFDFIMEGGVMDVFEVKKTSVLI